MIKIIGIAGSLRKQSYNTALLHAAAQLLPEHATLEIASIRDIPLYNEDIETTEGIPQAVSLLQERIAASDALLLATPEYNHSMPGVLKNAIDWLSRPPEQIQRVFSERPVAVIGATPGGFGTMLSQNAWLPVFRRLGMRPWLGEKIMLSKAQHVFDENGKLQDEVVRKQLASFLAGFVAFVQANRPDVTGE
ncbi:MAG: NAD(P)H-dependent oxidoreductase [Nitrosomonas sp.]|nr:NAD(P)H-dependent oxidoreductase [Nitrosomonas sp.]